MRRSSWIKISALYTLSSVVDVLENTDLCSFGTSVLPLSNSVPQNHTSFLYITLALYNSTACWLITALDIFFRHKKKNYHTSYFNVWTRFNKCLQPPSKWDEMVKGQFLSEGTADRPEHHLKKTRQTPQEEPGKLLFTIHENNFVMGPESEQQNGHCLCLRVFSDRHVQKNLNPMDFSVVSWATKMSWCLQFFFKVPLSTSLFLPRY